MGHDFVITNTTGTAYLNFFAPNDLPKRTKNGFSIKNMFSFSKREYIIFRSYDEAEEALNAMRRECNDENNIKRWDMVHWAADGYIKNFVCKLKIKRL